MTDSQNGGPSTGQGESCRDEALVSQTYRVRLEGITNDIIRDCSTPECHTHIGYEPIP